MLSIDGFECAGHPGEDDVGGLVLLALAAKELKIPYLASGGIGNGRGLAAAIALGACGVNCGTLFMPTKESYMHVSEENRNRCTFLVMDAAKPLASPGADPLSGLSQPNIKNAMIQASERDTTHIFRTLNNTARVFKNKVATEVVALERRPGGAKFPELAPVRIMTFQPSLQLTDDYF